MTWGNPAAPAILAPAVGPKILATQPEIDDVD